ncbi:MAG: hypothetical protein KatS3mg031_2912 [Chitinophagales bacterium]|nr:MAG: hypothetical protein KatS3mg031_2912 [Chitinophagales bacterium]
MKIIRRSFEGAMLLRNAAVTDSAGGAVIVDGGQEYIHGVASVTGIEYKLLESEQYIFVEEISKGAFEVADLSDVVVLFNHDPSQILGRTTAGSALVYVRDGNLHYEFSVNQRTTWGQSVVELIKGGEVRQSSFGFTVPEGGDSWEDVKLADGRLRIKRTINKIDKVWDVSPVTWPASNLTSVGVSLDTLDELERFVHAAQDLQCRQGEALLICRLQLLTNRKNLLR